jgi:type II secretory pathway pseudopilin PulG
MGTTVAASRVRGRRVGAFTLIELLAVVVIMLLMLRLILPSLDGILGGDAQGMARSKFIGSLNQARTMALNRGGAVYVVFMPLFPKDIKSKDLRPAFKDAAGNLKPFSPGLFAHLKKYFEADSSKSVNMLLGGQLRSYALYAEDEVGVASGGRWLTDWKTLPSGYFFETHMMASLPDKVRIDRLKMGEPTIYETLIAANPSLNTSYSSASLELPCLKYNGRGELEGAGAEGLYLAVSRGGVFPPPLSSGRFKAAPADPPESEPGPSDRYWFHINGITGRAISEELNFDQSGGDLSLRWRSDGAYNVYIYASPQWPADFRETFPGNGIEKPSNNYAGKAPWRFVSGRYSSNRNADTGKHNPAYVMSDRAKALERKYKLQKIWPQIGVRIEPKNINQ